MSYTRKIIQSTLVISLLQASSPVQLIGQPAPRATSGVIYGVALGLSHVSLRALPSLPAVRGTDVALGWHVGYQTSSRLAVKLAATTSVYRYPGPGRSRKRGFETLMPTLEYRVDDHVRVSAGAGVQFDAPVFYDIKASNASERRFYPGLGAVFGLSYTPHAGRRYSPDLQARYNVGYTDVPQGRLVGQTGALLVGMRRDPTATSRQP
jgi:hypothetical protein